MSKISNSKIDKAALNVSKLFSGSLSDDEAREKNAWNDSDPDYQHEFLANAHLLADVDALRGDEELLNLVSEPEQKHQSKRTIYKLSMVASFLLVIAVGLFNYLFVDTTNDTSVLRYVSRIGEVKTVNLSDGSIVTLNTGTQIIVNMGEGERRVILERGEAYFDVTRDESRPFSVDAGQNKVTVLGTKFSVRKQPEKIEVVVTEGVVCVHKREEDASVNAPLINTLSLANSNIKKVSGFRVKAGWTVALNTDEGGLDARSIDNVKSMSSWQGGSLEFVKEPLYKIVQELNRYSRKKILIEDPNIIELKVTAVIKINSIDQALRDLSFVLPIKMVSHFDRIVLTGI